MNFNFSHPFKSKIFHNKLNSSSLYSSVTEHTSPLISKYKPGQATKITINTHWSGRRRHTSNHGHIQRPFLPQDTQSIHQKTHQYKMKRHCSLYRLKRPSWKSSYTIISLLSLISLSYSGSLRTFVRMPLMSRKNPTFSTFFLASGSNLPFLSDYHDGSCFTFYPQVLFDQNEENEP